jgi:hypothetical protein
MVNGVRKGRETELRYTKLKESQGYLCFKPIKSHRFVKQQDIFGYFDIICMNEKEVLLVQVKTATYKKGFNELQKFNKHPSQVKIMLAVWNSKKKEWGEHIC